MSDAYQRQTPSRRRRAAKCTIAAGAALCFGTPVAAPVTGNGGQVSFHAVAHWVPSTLPTGVSNGGLIAGNTSLVADPQDGLLYAVSEGNWIAAYHLDSLVADGGGLATDPLTTAIPDKRGGRLLAAAMPGSGIPVLDSLDVSGGAVKRESSVPLPALAGQWIVGLYQPDPGPTVYAITAQYLRQNLEKWMPQSVEVAKLDIGDGSSANLVWTVALPACQTPIGYTQQPGMAAIVPHVGLGYAPADHSLYFGCTATSVPNQQRSPLPSGVGRLVVPTDGSAPSATTFQLNTRPGEFQYGDAFYDSVSQRLLMTAGLTRASVIAYDIPTHAYVGDIAAGPITLSGAAVNESTGQFYGMSPVGSVGLLAAFIRTTPVSQAASFAQFAPKNPNANPIAVDPTTNRLFVAETTSTTTGDSDFWVLQYDGGTYVPPALVNPDSNTSNMADIPGQSGHTFSGSVQGYGAVERWVGGLDAAVQDFGFFEIGSDAPVGTGSRELRLGYINAMSLGVSEATTSAVAADRDPDNTARDTAGGCEVFGPLTTVPAPSPLPAPGQATGPCGWPYLPAQCTSFDGTQQANHSNSGGEAASTCDAQDNVVSSVASFHGGDSMGVQTHEASISAKISLDPASGLVSTVTSTAKGIDALGGALQIGQVITTATSRAHGRPGTAGGQFSVQVSNVVVQGSQLCGDQCDTRTLATEINSQFNGLLSVDFPTADPQLQQGSPGGYQDIVRRAPGAQVQEQVLNDQPADRTEVPGMIITLYLGDSEKPARLISYLAGAETEARYGIYALNGQGGAGDGAGGSAAAAGGGEASGVGALQAALGGLPAQLAGGSAANGGGAGASQSPLAQLLPPGGWRWVVEHPLQALKLLFVWLVLLSPVYVAARRWLLLQRNRVLREMAA